MAHRLCARTALPMEGETDHLLDRRLDAEQVAEHRGPALLRPRHQPFD